MLDLQKKQYDDRMSKLASPSQDMITAMVYRGCLLGQPCIHFADDLKRAYLDFDYYLATLKIVYEFSIRTVDAAREYSESVARRRQYLKEGDTENYRWEKLYLKNFEELASRLVLANFFQALKIGKSIYERADQKFKSEPDKRRVLKETLSQVAVATRADLKSQNKNFKPIPKPELLALLEEVFEEKFEIRF